MKKIIKRKNTMEHPLSNAAKLALFEATTCVSKLGWRWKELIMVKLSDYTSIAYEMSEFWGCVWSIWIL